MNKNCVILEIRKRFKLDPLNTPPGSQCIRRESGTDVWPMLDDYDSSMSLFTYDEAVAEVDRLTLGDSNARYQVVVVFDLTP